MNSPADGRKRIFPSTSTKFPLVSAINKAEKVTFDKKRTSIHQQMSGNLKKKDIFNHDTVDDFDPF